MIRVTRQRHWMAPELAERDVVAWGLGLTPRSLAPSWADPDDGRVWCAQNGTQIRRIDWDTQLADGCHLVYSIRPGYAAAGWAVSITAQAGVAGAGAGGFFAFALPLLKSFALSLVANALLAPGKQHIKVGDRDSSTYAFLGLQSNARGIGMPIPVVYGRHRIAPPVINQTSRNWLDGNGDAQSEILLLFAVSEGPIRAIGNKTTDGGPYSVALGNPITGLQVENQPAENFTALEAYVRLGTNDQDPIPGFSRPVLQYGVDSVLRESADTVNVEVTSPGVFSAGDAEITKWDTAVGYTMGDEADEFTAVITFHSGLYKISTSTGELQNNQASFQTRYRKVDGSGTPYGDYIVLPTEPLVQVAKQGQFSVEVTHRFFDTVGYTAPTAGHYLSLTSGASIAPWYAILSSAIETKVNTEFSWVGWIKSDGILIPTAIYTIFNWYTTGNVGFKAYLYDSGGTHLAFAWGDGSATASLEYHGPSGYLRLGTQWHHVAFTYAEDFNGTGLAKARIYVDGVAIRTNLDSYSAAIDLTEIIYIGARSGATLDPWRGGMDDCAFFNRALTPFEIVSKWNQGQSNAPTYSGDELGLIVAFQFDTMIFDSPFYFSPEVLGPGKGPSAGVSLGTTGTDAAISSATGIVASGEGGTASRDTFLVEIQRIEPEDTANNASDESTWSLIQLRTDQDFEYPSVALLAVRIRATDQINSSDPLVTTLVDGRLVPVWDGVDAQYPTMVESWSRSPAWIAADLLLNERYGMGAYYEPRHLDSNQFAAFASWCAEVVYDGQETVALLGAASVTGGGANAPNWTVDAFEYRTATLPASFVQPTASLVSSGSFLLATGTSVSPSFPTFITSQFTASAAEVREVIYDSANGYYRLLVPSVVAATGSVFSVAGGDYAVKQYEPRMLYDGVFDRRDRPAWDALLQMLSTARAMPLRLGARLSIFYDAARDPVALIGMGSILPGTFKMDYTDIASRPNAEEIEFSDARQNYERVPAELEHPDLTDPTLQSSFRWRRLSNEGITRRSQVLRHIKRDLNVFNLLRRTCEFEVGIDSLLYNPGDRIAIAHDAPTWGMSGRVWEDTAENNYIEEWVDLSQWTLNSANALTAAETATVGPLGYGTVFQLSTAPTATNFASWTYDAGAWPIAGGENLMTWWVLEGTATEFQITVRDEDASANYTASFDWTAGVPVESAVDTGVSTTITAVGSGWYRIDVLVITQVAASEAQRAARIRIPLSAPFASQDMEVWGPMLLERTSTPNATPAMQVKLDRELTIAAATDYQIQVENASANVRETVRVNTIATPAGIYSAGSAITLSASGFSFLPERDDKWALGTVDAGDSEDFTVAEITLVPDRLAHRVKAVEYNEAVYDDDFGTLDGPASFNVPRSGSGTIPPGVHTIRVREETVTGPDGAVTIGCAVSFLHFAESFHAVWETRVYVADGIGAANLGAAELVATLPRSTTSARILNFPFARGRGYTICIQPVTRHGGGQYRAYASLADFTPDGLATPPFAPRHLRGSLAGYHAVYKWDDPGDLHRVRAVELRRGGWILGQRIAALPAGSIEYGPTPDWVGSPVNSIGQTDLAINLRTRLGTGQMSPIVTLSFAPNLVGSDGDALETSREDLSWAGTLAGVQVLQDAVPFGRQGPPSQLGPSGAALSHTYTFTGETFSTSIPVALQVGVLAYQIHPATVSQVAALGTMGSRALDRWTIEGPLCHLPGDPGLSTDCAINIQIAHSPSATAGSDYQDYRPGIYHMRSYRLKLTITRPSTDYGFRINRLAVRATKIQAARQDFISQTVFSPA